MGLWTVEKKHPKKNSTPETHLVKSGHRKSEEQAEPQEPSQESKKGENHELTIAREKRN